MSALAFTYSGLDMMRLSLQESHAAPPGDGTRRLLSCLANAPNDVLVYAYASKIPRNICVVSGSHTSELTDLPCRATLVLINP